MNKVKKILVPILIALSLVGSYFVGFFTRDLTFTDLQRSVLYMLEKYEKYYYYQDDNVVDVISNAIFDKYSTFYSKEEYDSILKTASGKNFGIGLGFIGNTLTIEKVYVNSPCDKMGVKSGGTVVGLAVDGEDKPFSDLNGFINALNVVEENQDISLTVSYSGDLQTYSVSKKVYQRSYVTYKDSSGTYNFIDGNNGLELTYRGESPITAPSVGYIIYEEFSGREDGINGSAEQLKQALLKFKQNGKSKLIFDLRNNGGGYMDVLSNVTGMLVEPQGNNQVISISIDKNGKEKSFYSNNQTYSEFNFNEIIVLANENSASASEVLIGAMLDYDKSNKVKIVLDGHEENSQIVYRTYGKGIMQTTYVNLDSSAVKLTTAEIFWPITRISIHGKGVTTETSNKVYNAVNGDALSYALNM